MATLQPTNYVRPRPFQENLVFRPKRPDSTQPKRSGFLPPDDAGLIISLRSRQTGSRANRRGSTFNPSNAAPVTTRRQGTAAYLRSKERNSTSAGARNSGATYQRTFSGALRQSAKSGGFSALSAQSSAKRNSQFSKIQSPVKKALHQYGILNTGVRNTTDLLNRGAETYRRTSKLNPAALKSLTNRNVTTSTLPAPPTLNSIGAQSVSQYSLFIQPTGNSARSIDIYRKVGPKRIAELSLFA